MIFHVVDECEKRNLPVSKISFDGQWYRVLVRDSIGYPLTKLQLQKDVFAEAMKTSKSEIINYIVFANMIQNVGTLEDIKDKVEIVWNRLNFLGFGGKKIVANELKRYFDLYRSPKLTPFPEIQWSIYYSYIRWKIDEITSCKEMNYI